MDNNKSALIIYIIALCVNVAYSKTMGNPGEGGGAGNEIGPNSSTVLSGGGLVNQLTGMPSYSFKALRMLSNSGFNLDLDFYYGSSVMQEATQPNHIAPTGWCGLGWQMGFSSIYSVDDDTALGDDRYYYVYANGAVSEIVQTVDGKYRIKNDPFWIVEKIFGGFPFVDWQLTYGWKITKTDGSVLFFGIANLNDVTGSADFNLWPRYNVNDSLIMLLSHATNPPIPVAAYINYKRWNLNYGEDINGSRISFKYQQIWDTIHTPYNGNLPYVRESHVTEAKIEDNGDRFLFITDAKSAAEKPSVLSTYFPNFYETKYLRAIRYVDKNNRLLDSVSLIYSGDPGQLPHYNSGTAGFAKRFLIGITSQKSSGAINRFFEYDRNSSTVGMLTRISEPVTGKSTAFSYGMQSIMVNDGATQHEYQFPVVTAIKVYDGLKPVPAYTTTYSYPANTTEQKYIPVTGLGFWGIVKANSGTGDVITRYDINPGNHLFGTPLNITMYNTNGRPVSQQKSFIESRLFITMAGDTFYYPIVSKNEKEQLGVTTLSGLPFCALDTNNGTSSMVYKTNSDDKTIVTKNDFAYLHYNGMGTGTGGTRQMSQTAATTVYEAPRFVPNCDLLADSVDSPSVYMPTMCVSATFTTWARGSGSTGPYRPSATYAWKSDVPVPSKVFPSFNPATPTANGWVLTGTIEKYNSCGSVLDAVGPTGTHSSIFYRSDYNLPIAKITNGRYDECAVFTGDYDVNDSSHSTYFDYPNGWEKAGAVLRSDTTHFGEKAVYVNNTFGPSRNIKIYQGTDYVFSAWVYAVSGTFTMGGDYRYLLSSTIPHNVSALQKEFSVAATAAPTGKWQRIEMRIPASEELWSAEWSGHEWCVRVYAGAPNGAIAFVDDIRFYPVKALVNTVYYDTSWRTPRIEIDANHVPGNIAVFDSVGRLKSAYKINKERCAQESGYGTITMSKNYHLIGDDLRVLAPNGGEQLRAGSEYAITWWPGKGIVSGSGVDIRYYDGTSWTSVATGVTDRNAYTWPIPAVAATGCRIKVVSCDDTSKWDVSDTTFSTFTNRAPFAPLLLSPINGSDYTNDTVLFIWKTSIDLENNPVTYSVQIRRNQAATWTTVVVNYADTQQTVVLPGIGPYEWFVTASDGSLSATSGIGKFNFVPDVFIIRDIKNRMIQVIPADLYAAIYSTLSATKQTAFANTYRNTTDEPGCRVFEDRGYFSSELSPYDANYATDNFSYNVNHLHKSGNDKWLGWVYEGTGTGYTGLGGGGGCGGTDGEMRTIVISPNIPNPPAITFYYNWACPNNGTKSYSWNEEIFTSGRNAIMRIKWTTVNGYHTWYKGWNRGGGDSGWKHDGEWTGDGQRKLDKIWLRMYKYDAN